MAIKKDSFSKEKIPCGKLYGPSTQRAVNNFQIGWQKMPVEIITAYGILKKAAALANYDLKSLSKPKKDAIVKAAEEVIANKLHDHFPLKIWQSGSGTQTNMNINEVMATRANEYLKQTNSMIHPNDDVNMSQSTNDTFISVMHIASYLLINEKLLPIVEALIDEFDKKSKEYKNIKKVGRTHLMDAVSLTLGDEFSAFSSQLKNASISLKHHLKELLKLPMGGSAVGTGINVKKGFSKKIIFYLNKELKSNFSVMPNKFEGISTAHFIVRISASLKEFANIYIKIAKDLTFLSSGPRCGINEIKLPKNEPGSSIMPGKINPTQLEAMKMVAFKVIGNDLTINLAQEEASLQLQAARPVMIYSLLESIHLLADMGNSFLKKCLSGLKPNKKNIKKHLSESLMEMTSLCTELGYDKVSEMIYTEEHKK